MSDRVIQKKPNFEAQLLFVFLSIAPAKCSKREIQRRAIEYRVALKQICRILPNSWEMILCENTLEGSSDRLGKYLELDLSSFNISMLEKNSGTDNKGIGELDMMVKGLEDFPVQVNRANTISYLTGRRLVTNQYIFERANSLVADALLSNPDFYYLDGKVVSVEKKGMYNDMFFSMKRARFLEYADFFQAKRSEMIRLGVGSEQNLYNFVHEKNLDLEWLETLGLMRREKQMWLKWFSRDKIHIC
jgi:hypothetical protein